jgi:CDP-diacylglycerol---glycerol-3-phosphate 3-phosphatidyltransferase
MDNKYLNNNNYLKHLRFTLAGCFILFLWIDIGLDWLSIRSKFGVQGSWYSIIVSITLGLVWFGLIWKNLSKNHGVNSNALFPTLGLPNNLTIIRGFLVALAAGLLLIPLQNGIVTWLPGTIFLTVVLLDGVDGVAARLTGRVTALGEFLDIELDSITVLIGSVAVFISDKAAFLILLVGAARYLFVGGQWLLKKMGRQVFPLRAKPTRRALAGAMMGFLAAAMFPVFFPLVLRVISYFFILPFLIGFLDDWCQVSGFEIPSREKIIEIGKKGLRFANHWLLPGLRLALIILMLIGSFEIRQVFIFPSFAIGILLIISLALLTGTAGRLAAIGLIVLVGMESSNDTFVTPVLLILISGCIIFLLGTGRFSFWKPEDVLIFHRIGDHDQS